MLVLASFNCLDATCPDFSERIDIPVDYWRAIKLDAKFSVRDCTNCLSFNTVLCRNRMDASKGSRRQRYHCAGAAFAKKRGFSRLVRGLRRNRYVCSTAFTIKAGFCKRDSETSIAQIMGGENCFLVREFHQACNQAFLAFEI